MKYQFRLFGTKKTKKNQSSNDNNNYPNPTSSITNIHLISQESGQLLLYNLNGQIIKNISFQNISNIELNIADLENGIYHLQLITLKKTFNSKIIKN